MKLHNLSAYCSWDWTQNFTLVLFKCDFHSVNIVTQNAGHKGVQASVHSNGSPTRIKYISGFAKYKNLRMNTSDSFSNSIRILCFSMLILFFCFLASNMSHVLLTRLKEQLLEVSRHLRFCTSFQQLQKWKYPSCILLYSSVYLYDTTTLVLYLL